MDSSLTLRMAVDRGDVISPEQALSLLNRSALVQTLTQPLVDKPLFYVWRLIALSELPFARQLPYTQALLDPDFSLARYYCEGLGEAVASNLANIHATILLTQLRVAA